METMKCPICNAENEVIDEYMYDPPVGICEHYYCCKNCGYIEQMAYSPYYVGFNGPWYSIPIKMLITRLKNFKKFIKVLKDEHYISHLYKAI